MPVCQAACAVLENRAAALLPQVERFVAEEAAAGGTAQTRQSCCQQGGATRGAQAAALPLPIVILK